MNSFLVTVLLHHALLWCKGHYMGPQVLCAAALTSPVGIQGMQVVTYAPCTVQTHQLLLV